MNVIVTWNTNETEKIFSSNHNFIWRIFFYSSFKVFLCNFKNFSISKGKSSQYRIIIIWNYLQFSVHCGKTNWFGKKQMHLMKCLTLAYSLATLEGIFHSFDILLELIPITKNLSWNWHWCDSREKIEFRSDFYVNFFRHRKLI